MSKELLNRLRIFGGERDNGNTYHDAAGLIKAQARDIARLKWYEEQYLLENTDIGELRAALVECQAAMTHALTGSLSLPRFADQELGKALTRCKELIK